MRIHIKKWVQVEGKVYELPKVNKIGSFFKSAVKKAVETAKHYVKIGIAYVHEQLVRLEDYILEKLDDLGKWAEGKIEERFPEEPEPELTPEPIV